MRKKEYNDYYSRNEAILLFQNLFVLAGRSQHCNGTASSQGGYTQCPGLLAHSVLLLQCWLLPTTVLKRSDVKQR